MMTYDECIAKAEAGVDHAIAQVMRRFKDDLIAGHTPPDVVEQLVALNEQLLEDWRGRTMLQIRALMAHESDGQHFRGKPSTECHGGPRPRREDVEAVCAECDEIWSGSRSLASRSPQSQCFLSTSVHSCPQSSHSKRFGPAEGPGSRTPLRCRHLGQITQTKIGIRVILARSLGNRFEL